MKTVWGKKANWDGKEICLSSFKKFHPDQLNVQYSPKQDILKTGGFQIKIKMTGVTQRKKMKYSKRRKNNFNSVH